MTKSIHFILSSPRSGSSLTRSKLSDFEDVICLPNDIGIAQFIHSSRTSKPADLKELFKKHWVNKGRVPDDTLWQEVFSGDCSTYDELLGRAFQYQARASGRGIAERTVFVEKSANTQWYIDALNKSLKNIKFIYLYRDPRDVVASLNQKPWSHHNAVLNAHRWKREQAILLNLENVYKLSYETFVSDNGKSLQDLLRYLGHWRPEQAGDIIEHDKTRYINPKDPGWIISNKFEGKYKSTLSRIDREQEIIEWICGPYMRQLGYTPEAKNYDAQFIRSLVLKGIEFLVIRFISKLRGIKET